MSLVQFLKSKVFFKQVLFAVLITATIAFVFFNMLSFFTKHGQELAVPDLNKMTVSQVEEKLSDVDLDYVILDTMDYNSDFPKFSVVIQDPVAGYKVKEGRKIYVKLNSDGYSNVTLPNLIEKTFRQAEPTLNALGLKVGEVTYKPYLGKDMVLEMKYKGKTIKPGTKVMKTSKIDLVLGDGKISFEDEEDVMQQDSIPNE